MKTTQELRAHQALKVDTRDSDFEPFTFRPRRSNIRHAYDDINRANKGRSWKNFRRIKWRA